MLFFCFVVLLQVIAINYTNPVAILSELVPPMNSNVSGDKYKGMLMTGRGDVEVLRTWLQCMCYALAIPVSLYFCNRSIFYLILP